jgi:hypothetical protein
MNVFLNFNNLDILNDSGKISHEVAEKLAIKEFKKYNILQTKTYISDFDNMVDKYLNEEK